MLRRHAIGFRALLMGADAILAVGLLIVLSVARFGGDWLVLWRPVVREPAVVALAYAALWVLVVWLHDLYRPRSRWTIRGEGLAIARATAVMAAITLSVLFAFRLPDVSRLFLLGLFPAQWALTLSTRLALRLAFRRMRERGYNLRFVLVVGENPRAQAFASKIEAHRELGLRVVGFIDDKAQPLGFGWRHLGGLESIERLLHEGVIDEVAVCLDLSDWATASAIVHVCEEEGKIVRVPVDLIEQTFTSGRIEDLDGTPVYSLVSGPDRTVSLATKRALDLVLSSLALVVLAPLFATIAILILIQDGRPILFRQVRIGLHGRRFEVLKFRTMVRDAEDRLASVAHLSEVTGAAFKLTNDPRVTRVGRFLRKSSLDELPQLWNVLRGSMSLVGPRPALPREVEAYDLWHRRRLSMKPGITGLWQVSARQSPEFDRWAELDLSYIDRWSLWLDLQILVRTVPAAFEGR
jgi:exopolysaccharide biosynthesis polyprenyl glycosylphosphotransferase